MKKKDKTLLTSVGVLALILSMGTVGTISSSAAVPGWTKSGDEWMYLADDGTPLTDVWRESKGYMYYLDESGKILKDAFFTWKGDDYYVKEDGKMAKDEWAFISEGEEPGWRYFGNDGSAYRRKNGIVVHNIDGKRYIFDENGVMLTGWIDATGNPVSDEDPFKEGMYFSYDDGAMLTDAWLDYYENNAGGSNTDSLVTQRNYKDYDSMWFYFDAKSKKLKSTTDNPKQRDINGGTYQFDENGVLNPWWGNIATVSNANRSNPTTLNKDGKREGTKYFNGSTNGSLSKNEWLWMYPSDEMSIEDAQSIEASWWRTDDTGRVVTNSIRRVNDVYYAFDGLGRMQSGFVLFDGRHEFVAQYDVDAWKKEDFIEGNIYGVERSDLYFFSNDELNDGGMKTGHDIYINIEDGTFAFGFGSNGKAIGGRNKMKLWNDSYYINGLRLDAPEDLGYGVVKETLPSGEHRYKLVNASGKVIKGHKKVVRDSEGGYYMLLNNCVVGYTEDEYKPVYRTGTEGTGFYHYDKKESDKYARGLAGKAVENPEFSDLPDDARLNF